MGAILQPVIPSGSPNLKPPVPIAVLALACLPTLIAMGGDPTPTPLQSLQPEKPAQPTPTPYEHTAPTNPALPPPDADIWKQQCHDRKRPFPPVSSPLAEEELASLAKAPTNAVILFDGKDLLAWRPSKWVVKDGYVEVTPHTGSLVSKQPFGSMKLHLEWWTPEPLPGQDGQKRNNSGIIFMGQYEVQVLDSFNNPSTYADGIAGSVYGQYPPNSNPIRPPGHWQYYDITFHRPEFDAQGCLTRAARVTVHFNGVRVQDDVTIIGPTKAGGRFAYKAHPEALPLVIQDHNDPIRFRNIWCLPIKD